MLTVDYGYHLQGLNLFLCFFLMKQNCVFSPQERKFVGGANQISECMARELGEKVKLQSAVHSIDQSGDIVEVKTVNEETYKARNFNSVHIKRFLHAHIL